MSSRHIEPCRGCHQPMEWVLSAKGNPQPIDPEPSPKGNLRRTGERTYVAQFGRELETVQVVKRSELEQMQLDLSEKEPLYIAHHATCPEVEEFRKKNR